MLLILAAAAMSVASPPESKDLGYATAGALADRCSGTSPADISYCFAYIAAVHDTMRAYEIWLGMREFCVPAGQSQADLRRAFTTYLSAYPTNRSGQAASVIVVSLKETYPCSVASPGSTAPSPPTAPPGKAPIIKAIPKP